MKKLKYLLALVIVGQGLMFTGCDSGFEETNTNYNDPTEVPANLLLAGTLRQSANTIQSIFLAGEAGSCWVQHLAKPVYNNNELYIPRQNSIERLWSNMYSTVLKDATVMQNLAAAEGNNDLQGVALVIKAYSYHVLTDVFGNIPMSEALQGEEGNFTPKYDDSKTEVYPAILAMLDQAITLLDGTGTIEASQDLVYGGNAMAWKKYASALKFRVIMRASGDASYVVGTQLQDLVNAGNLFTGNGDDAKVTYLAAAPNANPYFEGLVDGGRDTEWCLNKTLVDFMTTNNDPRLAVYAQEVGGNGSGNGYVGKPAGFAAPIPAPWNDSNSVSLIGEKYLEATEPAYFMTYAQLSFLMAEAANRGFITGSDAMYYAQGITASCTANGVAVGSMSTTLSGGLSQIAEQSWVALYLQGYEAWAEWRRTGSPSLTLAIDAATTSFPKRLNYPLTQQSLNNASYTQAVADQGADLLTSPLWWTN